MPRRPEEHTPLHLDEAPATPGQWEAWCWLWRRLLVKTPPPAEDQPGAASAPEEQPCADPQDEHL